MRGCRQSHREPKACRHTERSVSAFVSPTRRVQRQPPLSTKCHFLRECARASRTGVRVVKATFAGEPFPFSTCLCCAATHFTQCRTPAPRTDLPPKSSSPLLVAPNGAQEV